MKLKEICELAIQQLEKTKEVSDKTEYIFKDGITLLIRFNTGGIFTSLSVGDGDFTYISKE
jgi:hypothetical protein